MKTKLITTVILLIAAVVGGYFYFNKSTSTITADETDFAVKNVEDVTRIYIATIDGTVADLTLENGKWYINGKHEAKKNSIKLVLDAFKNFQIEAPVTTKAKENMLRSLAVRHKKVEIYKNNEDTPFKSIYIGEASQLLNGNLCLLETRKNGRAKNPYYVGIRGHRGIIAPMFFIKETDWMSSEVFAYNPMNITRIAMEYPGHAEQSFVLEVSGKQTALINPATQEKYKGDALNKLAIDEYLKGFEKIHFERLEIDIEKPERDSILSTAPKAIITVSAAGRKDKKIALYRKEGFMRDIDYEVIGEGEDINYFYGNYEGKFVLCQRFVFNKLFFGREDFMLKNN